ncbi:MAG: hypothetical protein II969_14035 [Anaerolineaceae bacterium]|nr:hypothetical protein [Anaerolineaceae bacterium]
MQVIKSNKKSRLEHMIIYVFADDADTAKIKAHDVIIRFWQPTAYYEA